MDERIVTDGAEDQAVPAVLPPAPPPPTQPTPPSGPDVEHIAAAPAASLKLVAQEAAARHQPIRMRMMLGLFNPATGQYIGWRGQIWRVSVSGIREAQRVQQAIEGLFDLIHVLGVERTVKELGKVKERCR